MIVENMRLVGIETNGSTRKLIYQEDTGFPQTSRLTFAVEVPPWVPFQFTLGSTLGAYLESSRVEAVGGGLASSGYLTYTFQPSGVADPTNRVYTSWASLMTAHNADTGQRIIYFDDSAGTITIPTGAQNFGGRTRLLPAPGRPTPMTITLTAGTTLVAPYFVSPLLTFAA
jgi:hypothetical protein